MDVKVADFIVHSLWILAASIAVVISAKKTLNGIVEDVRELQKDVKEQERNTDKLERKFIILSTECEYCRHSPNVKKRLDEEDAKN